MSNEAEQRIANFVVNKVKMYRSWLDEELNKSEAIELGVGYLMLIISINASLISAKDKGRTPEQSLTIVSNILQKESESIPKDSPVSDVLYRIMEDMKTWRI